MGFFFSPGTGGGGGGVTIMEDWEAADPLAAYSGSTGNWSVDGAVAKNGSNSGQCGTDFSKIYQTAPTEPFAKGEEVNFWCRGSAGNEAVNTHSVWYLFALEDFNDYYAVRVFFDNGNVQLYDNTNGSNGFVASFDMSIDPVADTWYRINVQRDDGSTFGGADNDINIESFDSDGSTSTGSLTANDATHAAGEGWGWNCDVDAANSETVNVDYLHKP